MHACRARGRCHHLAAVFQNLMAFPKKLLGNRGCQLQGKELFGRKPFCNQGWSRRPCKGGIPMNRASRIGVAAMMASFAIPAITLAQATPPTLPRTSPPVELPAVVPMTPTTPAAVAKESPTVVDLTPEVIPGPSHSHTTYPPPHGYEHGSEFHHHLEDTHGQWFATGEYLLWRPRMDGMGYAIVDPVDDFTPTGRVQNLNHDVSSGLRVGLGYRLPKQGWDVGVQYTYLHSTADQAIMVGPGAVIYPTYTRPGVIDAVKSAIGFASFDYHVFDIDVGRTWTVDEHFQLRTLGGIRLASLDFDYGSRYDGGQAQSAMVTNRSAFDGAGPTAGLEAQWTLGRGLGLIGRTRGGLLYGDFSSEVVETNGVANAVLPPAVLTNLGDDFSGVTPFLSVALGGSWQWRNIHLTAGYEVTHYFGVASQPVLVDDFAEGKYVRKRNDFSFDGVFFRLGVTY